MKWSNEELVTIAEDVQSSIESAISDLSGVDEYKEVYNILDDALSQIKNDSEDYIKAYSEECKAELDLYNSQYERDVI